nr:hypothetical protein Iba_scaffold41506CG0010 [Ipomoea batatas]
MAYSFTGLRTWHVKLQVKSHFRRRIPLIPSLSQFLSLRDWIAFSLQIKLPTTAIRLTVLRDRASTDYI